jgi:hypothetical protein
MWRLRLKTERGWNDGFHINTRDEAKALCGLLNKLERDLTAVTEQRDKLAEALREIDMARLDDFMGPHDMALKCVLIARESLAAMKGGSDDN